MVQKRTWKAMDGKSFNAIKTMYGAGVSRSQIQQVTGRGTGTIQRVLKSATLEDYHQLTREFNDKYQGNVKPAEPVVPVVPEQVVVQEVTTDSTTGSTTDALNRIANGIERLADLWEATPNKRKLF